MATFTTKTCWSFKNLGLKLTSKLIVLIRKPVLHCVYSYRVHSAYTVTRSNAKFHCPYRWRCNKLSMERKMFLPCGPQFSGENNAHGNISASMLLPSSMLLLAPCCWKCFCYCWTYTIAGWRPSISTLLQADHLQVCLQYFVHLRIWVDCSSQVLPWYVTCMIL